MMKLTLFQKSKNILDLNMKDDKVHDPEEIERIDWTEISRRGLLRRINEEIMHPLGLAVYRDEFGVSGGALVSPDGKWEYPSV